MKKRILGVMLAAAVMLTGIPVQSFAADVERSTEITEKSISEETYIVGSENGAESERAEAIQPGSKKQEATLAKAKEITPDETVVTPDETDQSQIGEVSDALGEAADSVDAAGNMAEGSDTLEQVDATGEERHLTWTLEYGTTFADMKKKAGCELDRELDDDYVLPVGADTWGLKDAQGEGCGTVYFKITVPLEKCKITLSQTTYSVEDSLKTPKATIEYWYKGENVLSYPYSECYNIEYKNNDKPGTATAVITPQDSGYFTGKATKTFKITGCDISKCKVQGLSNQTYTGKAIKPKLSVAGLDHYALTKGTDYTLAYKNNKEIGTATITIKGKGKYLGSTKTVTFKINPKKVSGFQISAFTTSSVRLIWKKDAKVTGYEVYRYNEAKNKYVKLKTITKKSTTTYLSTGLRPGTRSYYQIRSYKTVKGKKYYGAYASTCGLNGFTTPSYQGQYEEAVKNAVASLKLNGKSEYQKVKKIHDYICMINQYAWQGPLVSGGFEVFVYGRSVCMGYAELFYDMAKTAGLAVDFVDSVSMNHAWNMVRVDGQWYGVDVTWDDPDGGSRDMYKYFLISEEEMKKSHTYETYYWGSGYIGYSGWMDTRMRAPYENVRATYNLSTMNYLDKQALKNTKFTSVKSAAKGKVTLKWTPQHSMTKYEIYRSEKKKSGYKKIKSFGGYDSTYTDSKVTSGKTYYYKVRCYKKLNGKKVYGKYSTVKSVKVK